MSNNEVLIVIPARWSSKRLPGKPLQKIADKYLLEWVIEIALKVKNATGVVVATDNHKIAELASKYKVEVIITSPYHKNGTERLIEVALQRPADFYVNLQGDEPLINPNDIELLIEKLILIKSGIVTLSHNISSEEALDSSRVKLVCNCKEDAILFSRNIIPFGASTYKQHVGIYGFCKSSLDTISSLSETYLEKVEGLEQLRWIESGLKIKVINSSNKSIGVDTKKDAEEVERILKLSKIKVIFSDVDGVLTDGKIWYGKNGEELKGFNSKDGLAIKLLMSKGIEVCLVSARDSLPLRKRIQDLGIKYFSLGQQDKVMACKEILSKLAFDNKNAAFIGDDILDINPMNYCGWSFAVSDAVEPVIKNSKTVLSGKGGTGIMREVYEILDKLAN